MSIYLLSVEPRTYVFMYSKHNFFLRIVDVSAHSFTIAVAIIPRVR